ncbi:3005_t:CDS:2 [Scutellospora calospora]|uniref:3005_t:CDS:1 n=1 Tax=Scutellospora calospora TaxID=85575 RepID=A0ACA9KXP8_9GLOM|nr:3005_t:CDS:2 [Scutellospora calospora]
MEPSFFKISLPGTITRQSLTMVDLCLPSYKLKSGMDYFNPFYDDFQFKETVFLVQEKLINHPKDIIVLAGVSGGGKTSTAFGISMQLWSIYVDYCPSGGQYGDFMGQELERIRARPPKYGQTEEQSKIFDMLDLAIIARGLLLIKMLVLEKISTPQEWLFAQLRNTKEIQNKLHNIHNISSLIYYINECLNVESLILIFDEAQVLCGPEYGEYNGSSSLGKKWNLLQAYIEHLTHLPVTSLIAGTYMHMASGISLVTSVEKVQGLHAHIVLKLPFLSQNDVLRNLDTVIDLTDVKPKTRDYLGYMLRGRPRNCASFVLKLISERESKGRSKDQELRELLCSWFKQISHDMAVYLENACKSLGANNINSETAIIDVLRLRVFYNCKFKQAIELLQRSIIPCQSPECIILRHDDAYSNEIKINPSFESYLVSGIEMFLLKRGKTLVDVFVENIIRLNNTSSIGNEFDAVFITAMIQKRGRNVREELNKWKNGQIFDLPSWITPTMKFITISNLSGGVPIAEYVDNTTYYCSYAIQPDRFSGSDVVISFADDEQNMVLLSASCTVSGGPIKRSKIKEQVFKSCMKFQYMENTRKRKGKNSQIEDHEGGFSWKEPECLQIGLVSKVIERAKNHEKIKISTENRKHIYVSVELPHRASKRSELFRFNEYGDLVIIVDDRNMESVFGSVIKNESQENSMDQTE